MGAWDGKRLHFVGIAGAGLSAYAIAARALGAEVTGSDRAESPYLARVREAGIEPAIGHDAANVPEGDGVEVVVSTAIPPQNPEIAAARERGLLLLSCGLHGEAIRLLPPVTIGDEELTRGLDALEAAVREAAGA